MPQVKIKAFVQARMSSRRFPGKVLAPFRGAPLITHVLRRVSQVIPGRDIVVLTSDERSDDPLAAFLEREGIQVFRGSLDNVFDRFRSCLAKHPCEWILRVNADSPVLSAGLLQWLIEEMAVQECDLVTTIFPRTFPKGSNAELIKASSILTVPAADLDAEDQEHVTRYFYRHADRYRIRNIESGSPHLASLSFAVDCVEDLHRIESLPDTETEMGWGARVSSGATR